MEMRFDVAGRVTLLLLDPDERASRSVRAEMDPYAPASGPASEPAVVLARERVEAARRLIDVQNPAGDDVVTASDGSRPYILYEGLSCSLPVGVSDWPARFSYEPGFPLWRIFGSAIRPALQIAMLDRQAAAVHAASVEVDGAGVVIAGWSESGKTETALAFAAAGFSATCLGSARHFRRGLACSWPRPQPHPCSRGRYAPSVRAGG
jgi:hypothetical protein